MKRLHPKRRAGFTLIERIMTIVVVAIVCIPLSLLLSQHIRSLFQSEALTTARQLARFEMEKVNNMGYTSINSDSSVYAGYDYDVTRTVTYRYGSEGSDESLKKITVEVNKSGSAEVLVSLVTYLAKNVSYGL